MTTTYGTLALAVLPFGGRVSNVREGVSSDAKLGLISSRQTQSSANRQTGRRDLREWEFPCREMTSAEYAQADAAFLAGQGGTLPIAWTPPAPYDGAAIPVKVKISGVEHLGGGVWNFDLMLKEVI